MQISFHGPGAETWPAYLERLEYRVRFYRFFFPGAALPGAGGFPAGLREYRFAWVAAHPGACSRWATNFFPAFQFHYIAAATCLFILMSVTGLERLAADHRRLAGGSRPRASSSSSALAHFVFWYGLHAFEDRGDLARRAAIRDLGHHQPRQPRAPHRR